MGNVVEFSKVKANKEVAKVSPKVVMPLGNGGFTDEVKQDINVLCQALNISSAEQAITIARDFYRRYPALMEWVSSPDVAVYKGDDIVGLLSDYKL